MKVVNMKGSLWTLAEGTVKDKKTGNGVTRHFLKAEVGYLDEKGEKKVSFSRIPIEDSFFKKEEPAEDAEAETKADKKGKKAEEPKKDFSFLMGISDVLKEGMFDLDSIQVNSSSTNKKHIEWRIISSPFEIQDDTRLFVLGGFEADGIFFDSRISKNAEGRSTVIAFSQAYDKPDEEGKKVVKAVQFAALLSEGDTIAYYITNNNKTSVVSMTNIKGRVQQKISTPFAWRKMLIEKGIVKAQKKAQ